MKVITQKQTQVLTPNDKKVDEAKDLDIVIPMYNLIEYREIYSKPSGSL